MNRTGSPAARQIIATMRNVDGGTHA